MLCNIGTLISLFGKKNYDFICNIKFLAASQIVLDDLSRAREGFVLASDLHLVYLVTPINVDVEPNWELYYQRFMELSPLDQVNFLTT